MQNEFRRSAFGDSALGAGNYFYRYADACRNPDDTILECDGEIALGTAFIGRKLSVASLRDLSERVVAWLARSGVRERQAIGVFIGDSPLYYIFHMALCRIGAIPFHLNSNMSGDVAGDYLERTGCVAMLVDLPRLERLDRSRTRPSSVRLLILEKAVLDAERADIAPYQHAPDDPVLVAHTSGTTGPPKPVQFNHHGYFFGVRQQMLQPIGRKVLSALPHSHGSAVTMFMSTVVRGVPLLAQTRKDAQSLLAMIGNWKPQLVMAFPKPLVDLCRHQPEEWDLDSVSCWMSTGDASHEPHIRRLVGCGSRVHGGTIRSGSVYIDNLGSSEFAFGILRQVHSPGTNQYSRCIGRPFAWVDVEIFGEDGTPVPCGTVGRLAVKSPSVTSGYWNCPEATEANRLHGYWLTGDLVYRTADGLYFHVDRTTDRTLVADRTVYSCQVEELLMRSIDDLFDCTVVGVGSGDSAHIAVSYELSREARDPASVGNRIHAVLRQSGISAGIRTERVEPGWQEGLTGKKLKRSIRAGLVGTANA